jgi:ribosome maturation factor RimP
MSATERVLPLLTPLLEETGLRLYDLELTDGVLHVLVDREGGADIGTISRLARSLTRSLEVSTPGLERPLRTPAHFHGAIGADVKIKTLPQVDGERRLDGTLTGADDDSCTVTAADGSRRTLRFDEIERARTVFVWGPSDRKAKASP